MSKDKLPSVEAVQSTLQLLISLKNMSKDSEIRIRASHAGTARAIAALWCKQAEDTGKCDRDKPLLKTDFDTMKREIKWVAKSTIVRPLTRLQKAVFVTEFNQNYGSAKILAIHINPDWLAKPV